MSLPGNFALPVEFARVASGRTYLSRGEQHETVFGSVWDADIPYVVNRVAEGTWAGCSSEASSLPSNFKLDPKVYVPGAGEQAILGEAPPFAPSGYVFGTKNYWVGKCSGNDYIFMSPSGTKYKFSHEYVRTGTYQHSANNSSVDLDNVFLFVSEVTDASGNWVKYAYNAHGPTRIHSSDGREIVISYSGPKISKVSANGRDWTYRYVGEALSRVTLPDSTYWAFGENERGMEDVLMSSCTYRKNDTEHHIRHPLGTKGIFGSRPVRNRFRNTPFKNSDSTGCSGGRTVPHYFFVQGLANKTIELSDGTRNSWTYQYPADDSSQYARTKTRIVTDPAGTTRTYHVNNEWVAISNTNHIAPTGKIVKVETFARGSTSPMSATTNTYNAIAAYGGNTLPEGLTMSFSDQHHVPSTRTVERDGDTYTTTYTYTTDATAANFSYLRPVSVALTTNVPDSNRTTETTYRHLRRQWILGLTDTVTVNGTETSRSYHDTRGRRTSLYTFGKFAQRLYYHPDGTVSQVRDALARFTDLDDWHRGRPTKVTYSDGTTTSLSVDGNGWVTGATDQLGSTTTFEHDSMGRLTRITPPQGIRSWTPTAISYDFTNDPVQTITKGASRTTVAYDSMLRPVLETTEATDTRWASHVNTRYDAFGRVAFRSQPSFSTSETAGVETTYDALGRVTEERETVTPFAKTTHAYLSGNVHKVTDPSDNITETHRYGWSGPGAGPTREIHRHGGQAGTEITETDRDVFGRLTRVRREASGSTPELVQEYLYDSQGRMCGSFTPEGGGHRYAYDAAGQLTGKSGNHSHGWSVGQCYALTPGRATLYTYDEMGRLTETDYPDAATPDIYNTYDKKGRLTEVERGGVATTYRYNDMDLLTMDRVIFEGNYRWGMREHHRYNDDGHRTSTSHPSARWYDYSVDGLGRTIGITARDFTYSHHGTDLTLPGGPLVSGTTFHPDGSTASMTFSNGLTRTRTLDARQRTDRDRVSGGNVTALDLAYTYTDRGQVASVTDRVNPGQSHTYTYDGLGQLTRVFTGTDGRASTYGNGNYRYDIRGNLTRKVMNRRILTYTYDDRNRLSRIDSSGLYEPDRIVEHDSRGNVTRFGDLRMTYDASDMPVLMTGGPLGDVAYVYDGLGKRVMIDNGADGDGRDDRMNFYSQAGQLAGIYRYKKDWGYTDHIRANGELVATVDRKIVGGKWAFEPTYRHNDQLGSAQVGTDESGLARFQEYYTPYGEVISPSALGDDRAGYTGHIRDAATGLTYMQARYYSPVAGRMLSVDPVDFMGSGGDPRYVNRYMYAGNDPVNMWDPDGRQTCGYGTSGGMCDVTNATPNDETNAEEAALENRLTEWNEGINALSDTDIIAIKNSGGDITGLISGKRLKDHWHNTEWEVVPNGKIDWGNGGLGWAIANENDEPGGRIITEAVQEYINSEGVNGGTNLIIGHEFGHIVDYGRAARGNRLSGRGDALSEERAANEFAGSIGRRINQSVPCNWKDTTC